MLLHLNPWHARHLSHLNDNLRRLPSPWIIVHAKVELLLQKLICAAALGRKRLSEAERHPECEDVEPNPIVAIKQDMLVAAARVVLGRRPRAERIPAVDRLVLEVVDEVEK